MEVMSHDVTAFHWWALHQENIAMSYIQNKLAAVI